MKGRHDHDEMPPDVRKELERTIRPSRNLTTVANGRNAYVGSWSFVDDMGCTHDMPVVISDKGEAPFES